MGRNIENLGKYLKEKQPMEAEEKLETAEKGLEISARERGAELRHQTADLIKQGAAKFSELGGKLWGGLKRIGVSGKEAGVAGLDYAFFGAEQAAKLTKKAAAKTEAGVYGGARFVVETPDRVLDTTADGILAGAEAVKSGGRFTKRKATEATDWTVQKITEGKDWTADKYNDLKDWSGERADEIKARAQAIRESFTQRVEQAKQRMQERREAIKRAKTQAEISRLEAGLIENQRIREKIELQLQELHSTMELRDNIANQQAA